MKQTFVLGMALVAALMISGCRHGHHHHHHDRGASYEYHRPPPPPPPAAHKASGHKSDHPSAAHKPAKPNPPPKNKH